MTARTVRPTRRQIAATLAFYGNQPMPAPAAPRQPPTRREAAKDLKDWPKRAVDEKIEQQGEFVGWWKSAVGVRRGHPDNADLRSLMSKDDAESLTGITQQQVSKWRKRLEQRAKRRIGELTAELPDARTGPRPKNNSDPALDLNSSKYEVAKEKAGLSKAEVIRCERIWRVDEAVFERRRLGRPDTRPPPRSCASGPPRKPPGHRLLEVVSLGAEDSP